jgi:hypothetical protein
VVPDTKTVRDRQMETHLTLPALARGSPPSPPTSWAERAQDGRRRDHHAVMVRMNTGSRVPGLIENTASECTMLPSSSVVKTLVTPL